MSWQRYCTASSSRRQPKFAALNRGRHLCSAGQPSRHVYVTLGIGPHSSILSRINSFDMNCVTTPCLEKRGHFFSYMSENCAAVFIIFGTHHPNGSSKWVIRHFACILTAGVHSDDVTVMSVKTLFTEEDKHVIDDLRKDK